MKNSSLPEVERIRSRDWDAQEDRPTVVERMAELCSHVEVDPTLPSPIVWDFRKSTDHAKGLGASEATEPLYRILPPLMTITESRDWGFVKRMLPDLKHFTLDHINDGYVAILSSVENRQCLRGPGMAVWPLSP